MTLRRGFKAEAERTSHDLRTRTGVDLLSRVDLDRVAIELGARIISADTLVAIERLEEIERLQAFSFSACTFEINGKKIVAFNPIRTIERQVSDIAHELAHIILKHDLSEVQFLDGVAFRTCQADQEEEATALGGALLLPRPALLRAAKNGDSLKEIADAFGVSLEMARFRWNTTGVARQAAAANGAR